MSISSMDREKFNILPYDFVKENQIIASKDPDGYEVISPNTISLGIDNLEIGDTGKNAGTDADHNHRNGGARCHYVLCHGA